MLVFLCEKGAYSFHQNSKKVSTQVSLRSLRRLTWVDTFFFGLGQCYTSQRTDVLHKSFGF